MTDAMAEHATAEEDVIALLERQHQEIRALFTELETATDDERRDTFRRLVRLLAVHETAEEEVVHPAARNADGGNAIVDARLGEEHRAKALLSTLHDMGPDAEGFDLLLVHCATMSSRTPNTRSGRSSQGCAPPTVRSSCAAWRWRSRRRRPLRRPDRTQGWRARRPTFCSGRRLP